MAAAASLWVAFGLNHLLRHPFAVVPKEHAFAVQDAARDELGIVTEIQSDPKRSQLRVSRVGVVG